MPNEKLVEDKLSEAIIGAFYDVYNTLNYGWLEHTYAKAMTLELRRRGHAVHLEAPVDVMYKDEYLCSQRLDMIVDGKIIIEIKSTEQLAPIAFRQLSSYLNSTHLEVGLLLHFGPKAKFYRRVSLNKP
jgi:GxxExxY protein